MNRSSNANQRTGPQPRAGICILNSATRNSSDRRVEPRPEEAEVHRVDLAVAVEIEGGVVVPDCATGRVECGAEGAEVDGIDFAVAVDVAEQAIDSAGGPDARRLSSRRRPCRCRRRRGLRRGC